MKEIKINAIDTCRSCENLLFTVVLTVHALRAVVVRLPATG